MKSHTEKTIAWESLFSPEQSIGDQDLPLAFPFFLPPSRKKKKNPAALVPGAPWGCEQYLKVYSLCKGQAFPFHPLPIF